MHDKETAHDNADQTNSRPAWPERLESFLRAAEADFYLAISWFETEVAGPAQNPDDIRAARTDVQAAHAVLDLARSEMARAMPAAAWTLEGASAERVYGGVSWRALKEETRTKRTNVDAFHESAGYKRLAEAYLD